jgi:hypothetical protein
MSDDPIVQILLEAYQRGKEIAQQKGNAPSHSPKADPVTYTTNVIRKTDNLRRDEALAVL